MDKHRELADYVSLHPQAVNKVIEYNAATDHFYQFDFTADNHELSATDIADTEQFSHWINHKLLQYNCRYGIGGYMEHRMLYQRSVLFNSDDFDEPRRLHLGTDIWAPANTPVYAPLAGTIHSFRDNDHFGDYGPTLILQHSLDGLTLYSLYGHLSRSSLNGLKAGHAIASGQKIAALGHANENGSWPPHLHFQLMFDLQDKSGDYPGVGRYSEKESLKQNIPDPQLILQIPAANIIR